MSTVMDPQAIGRRLRELRGVFRTQAEVAEEIGITREALSNYENGTRVPRDEDKVRIAQFYGLSVQDLFFSFE